MESSKTKFTKHESESADLVQQHSNLLDSKPLLWTRGYVHPKPVTYAKALKIIERLNADNYGGFNNWRLAAVEERFLLSDRTRYPAIDTEYFEGEGPEWTGSVEASSPSDDAWYVYFYDGASDCCRQISLCFVRAVRSSQ